MTLKKFFRGLFYMFAEFFPNKDVIKKLKIYLVILGLPLLLFWFMANRELNSAKSEPPPLLPPAKVVQPADYSKDAKWACHEYVKANLKAPSTAQIPSHIDFYANQVGIKSGDVIFDVTGQVDAQNSYGAMLQSTFVCRVKRDPVQKDSLGEPVWHLVKIDFH